MALMVSGMLHTGYDDLIEKYRGQVPVAFMRALGYRESNLNPKSITESSNATGLFQITKKALTGYNQANNSALTLQDMLNPDKNVMVAGWFLNNVIDHWKHHPSLQPDWNSERFPSLLAFGYNAGWSDEAGIGYVAGEFENLGVEIKLVTVDNVRDGATALLKASKYLKDPKRASWAKNVARTFLHSRPRVVSISKDEETFPWGLVALTIGAAGALIVSRKK